MENSKQVLTPIVDIGTNADPKVTKSEKLFSYRELIGTLQYLSTKTRLDISFAINYANRFIENPSNQDITNVKRILRYLQETTNLGI